MERDWAEEVGRHAANTPAVFGAVVQQEKAGSARQTGRRAQVRRGGSSPAPLFGPGPSLHSAVDDASAEDTAAQLDTDVEVNATPRFAALQRLYDAVLSPLSSTWSDESGYRSADSVKARFEISLHKSTASRPRSSRELRRNDLQEAFQRRFGTRDGVGDDGGCDINLEAENVLPADKATGTSSERRTHDWVNELQIGSDSLPQAHTHGSPLRPWERTRTPVENLSGRMTAQRNRTSQPSLRAPLTRGSKAGIIGIDAVSKWNEREVTCSVKSDCSPKPTVLSVLAPPRTKALSRHVARPTSAPIAQKRSHLVVGHTKATNVHAMTSQEQASCVLLEPRSQRVPGIDPPKNCEQQTSRAISIEYAAPSLISSMPQKPSSNPRMGRVFGKEAERAAAQAESSHIKAQEAIQMLSLKRRAAIVIQKRFRGMRAREDVSAIVRSEHDIHLDGLRATAVVCGGCPFNHSMGHSAAVTAGGKVFVWGSAATGCLGIRSTKASAAPIQGQVFAAGSNSHGQLGLVARSQLVEGKRIVAHDETDSVGEFLPASREGEHCDDSSGQRKLVPVPIGGLPRIKLVACGRFHSLSVSESGELYSWGQGIDGQLGNGSTLSTRVPSRVGGLKDVVTVSAGVAHSAAVTGDGNLWCWGNGGSGRLGLGSTDHKLVPSLVVVTHSKAKVNRDDVADLNSPQFASVQCGASHTLALSDNGSVYAFGAGGSGQLGYGGTACRLVATELQGLPHICMVACGSWHSAALTSLHRRVYVWGQGENGQLGTGSKSNALLPIEVPLWSNGSEAQVASLSCGPYQTALVLQDGLPLMCGHGGSGQLGNNSYESKYVFTPVAPPSAHRYVKSKKDGQPRLVYEARKLRKFENGAFWIWDRDSDSWIECFACRLFKGHSCFCKIGRD